MKQFFLTFLILLFAWRAEASPPDASLVDDMAAVESILEIDVYLPRKNETSFRGSNDQRVQSLIQNPAVKLTVRDFQRLADMSFGKAVSCRKGDVGFADAVIEVRHRDGSVVRLVVLGRLMVDESRNCFALPKFVSAAMKI